jgi:RNA polymerase sigma factor (sigma-70 family)
MARARHRTAPWIDRDDLEGAAIYGLCRASAAWRGKGEFEPFAVQIIDIEIGEEVRRWKPGRAFPDQIDYDEERLLLAPEAEDDEAVHAAFGSLPDEDKEILSRTILGGESEQAATRGLGISRSTLRRRAARAIDRLRGLLPAPAMLA